MLLFTHLICSMKFLIEEIGLQSGFKLMIRKYSSFILILLAGLVSGCNNTTEAVTPVEPSPPSRPVSEFIERKVVGYHGTEKHRFINNHQLFSENWDTLGPARFWQEVITLSHDSMILNVASVRQPLFKIPASEWFCQTEAEKSLYKSNLCISNNLNTGTDIYVTGGKKFFFEFRKVIPMITKSIEVFEKNDTDPWYAQTILLIESPGKTEASSYAGARGPFQLMPYVARKYGLVVSRTRDDRTNLEKSAMAASKLIKNICIPGAKRILDNYGITYNERDLWFRLLVMHVYHAGAGNVALAINKIKPAQGGMELIRTLWRTEAGGFKNESQNYTQIALAAMILFDRMIGQDTEHVYLVEGDHMMRLYREKSAVCVDTLNYLEETLMEYGHDLVESMIPAEYYKTAIFQVKEEIRKVRKRNGLDNTGLDFVFADIISRAGDQLLYKRKFSEAAKVYHICLELNPVAPAVYNNLSKAYKLSGNHELALKYSLKSKEVTENPGAFLR